MKDICEKTGLSEKAVRHYIEQGLLVPQKEKGIHYSHYLFSERDVEKLQTIAALRAAGISIADIRRLQDHPEEIPGYVMKQQKQSAQTLEKQRHLTALLERMDVSNMASLESFARAVHPLRQFPEPEQLPRRNWGLLFGVTGLLALFFLLAMWKLTLFQRQGAFWILAIFLSAIALFMGIRYATATRRAKKLPHRAEAVVQGVVRNTGMDGAFAIATTAPVEAPWGGRGGWQQLFLMYWNEIRPDHWFPILHFTDETGEPRAATYPYGGLKTSWRVGQQEQFAWGKEPTRILPLHAPWLTRKGILYCFAGILGLLASLPGFAAWWEQLMALL